MRRLMCEGRRSRVWLALVVAALSCLAARVVRADAAHARAHYDKGRSYFQVGEYEKALEEFKAAHIEKNDPAFIYNIAECYQQLRDPKEALVFYRRFIRLAPAHPARADAERHIAELESAAGAAPRPSGGAQAVGPPPPASPAALGDAPLPLPASLGPAVALEVPPPPPPAPPPPPGAAAPPTAQVISTPADVSPGSGRPERGARRTVAGVVGGTGLVALAVGGYFGLRARSKWNDSGPHCPQDVCDNVGKTLSDDARTSARLSDVAFGAGVLGVGVAAYLYFTSAPASSAGPSTSLARSQPIRILPDAGPNGLLGVTVGTSW
jgi:hypothetical protein